MPFQPRSFPAGARLRSLSLPGRLPPAERWPGPEAVTFSTEYQLLPTQPLTRRSKAAPVASGQTVQVKSPPPNVSGGTASLMRTAQNSHFRRAPALRTTLRQMQTSTWSQKGCRNSRVKPFFQSSRSLLALARGMADIAQKEGKSEQPGGWYQPPIPRSSTKLNCFLESSSWTFIPRSTSSLAQRSQHDLLNSAPGDWDCRQPFSLKLCLWGYSQRTWVLCSSGVLFNERTGSSFSACSIASTSLLRRLVNKNCGQQNVCPLVLSKVRRNESNPSRFTWTPWIAAAARKSQLTV